MCTLNKLMVASICGYRRLSSRPDGFLRHSLMSIDAHVQGTWIHDLDSDNCNSSCIDLPVDCLRRAYANVFRKGD